MKIKLNTKLRLENSALGTYELTAGESNKYSCTLPKGLKPENLIGTIICIDDIMYYMISGVLATYVEGTLWRYSLVIGMTSGFYYPDTGVLEITMA